MVRGKGEGGGGADERRSPQKSEGNRAFNQQARFPGDGWRRAEGITKSAGGAVSRWHRTNREGSRASEAGATRATPGNETRDSRKCGGRRLLKPLHQHLSQLLPAAQVKGGARAQPSGHWDGQQEQHGTGRQSVLGGRRVTTGATGEATNNRKTDGEEARGGEIGMHAQAK